MIDKYIHNINLRYKLGNATEHTFRGDLQQLIENLNPGIRATNEPKRQKCGAPDYILTRKDIPVGFIEAKDIGDADLDGLKKTGNKEQFDRYKASLNNLIFTDYLNFHLYRDGQLVNKVTIGEVTTKGIRPLTDNFGKFEQFINDFCSKIGQTIKSSKKLAEMMAGKARLLSDVIEKSLTSDETHHEDSTLKDQMNAFKQILIHDITPKSFADVYAQTIAYGMFAARSHDPSLPTFSRQEAFELIPRSNPFLKKLFGYIAGLEVDDRIKWIVDDLVQIFLACDVAYLLKDYGKGTRMEDPIIHFYEDFLSAYDPALRKARGVWYTPQPVVNFIVRAVDDILKTEFGLPQGLADTSKTKIKVDIQGKKVEQEVHKVQILDPATGTGTFLAEVVKLIHHKFEGQQGIWSNYVENHLLPRLNGFELLMASYAMAHLKLDLLLTETGYKPTKDQRLRVYLTNSLEEHHPDTDTLFANWLSTEANEANRIKRDTPVMCIIGNPPYSGESANKGKWIMNLMEDYKKEPGGTEKLKEQNSKFINDDYVKFIRYGQHFIEKNGSGILAFINPHGFIDNPTFRGMRWKLLTTFDAIYIIDLHGNSKKKEIIPGEMQDENVFDIQQGVSINIFLKVPKKNKDTLARVYHSDLFGKRENKYIFLQRECLKNVGFKEVKLVNPDYLFIPQNWEIGTFYKRFFSLRELFVKTSIGLQSHRDELVTGFDKKELQERFEAIFSSEKYDEYLKKYSVKESLTWSLKNAVLKSKGFKANDIIKLCYRAFDSRYIYYNDNFVDRTRRSIGREVHDTNVLINFPKIVKVNWNHTLITKSIPTAISMDINGTYCAPLYCRTNNLDKALTREPNLDLNIVNTFASNLRLAFISEKEPNENTFAPIDILDYIYAVLHSPTYREKYKEFLKIDFPRVPYPKDRETFWRLVELGGQIRQIHLLESPVVEQYITQYPVDGSNEVVKPIYLSGKVHINDTQYFNNVPEVAWNFYIGGYQPAQKWLKDRKGRRLDFDDIQHYQKIIVALSETNRLMKEIDEVEVE